LIAAWHEKFANTRVAVSDIYPLACEIEGFSFTQKDEKARRTALGMLLKKKKGVIFGDHRIKSAGTYRRAAQYMLEKCEPYEPGEPCNLRPFLQKNISVGEKVHIGSQGSHPEDDCPFF